MDVNYRGWKIRRHTARRWVIVNAPCAPTSRLTLREAKETVDGLIKAGRVPRGIGGGLSRRPQPWDECECEHTREDHDENGCQALTSSGLTCACPSFKESKRG